MDYGLRTADYGLRTTDCGLRTADYGLRTTDCQKANRSWNIQQEEPQKEELCLLRELERTVVLRVGHYETKVLNWPEEKAQDSASPDRFIIFLMRCKSAMELAANT